MVTTHTLVLLVEDHPGVLNRVVSLMRRRNFNIDSITVGHSEQPGVSRMTIQLRGESEEIDKVFQVSIYCDATDYDRRLVTIASHVRRFNSTYGIVLGIIVVPI